MPVLMPVYGKFSFTFDYYESITDNLIVDLSLPTSVGFSSVKENIGKVKNSGLILPLLITFFLKGPVF